MTEPSKKDEIWRWKRRVKSCCERLMPCAPMERVKQADAVEAAIEDELIALRVGPFLRRLRRHRLRTSTKSNQAMGRGKAQGPG